MLTSFYLLKVRLLDIEPEIWRRFVVPSDITLDRLHDVIQIVMGWNDFHLHEFTIGKKRYTEYPEAKEDGLTSGKFILNELIKQRGRKFLYTYDFGDHWQHELLLEDNHYIDPNLIMPIFCLEGQRACPPEDVGGVPGYYEFCEALEDSEHPEHDRWMEWSGGYFDSENFSTDAVNWYLMQFLRWSRSRHRIWGED